MNALQVMYKYQKDVWYKWVHKRFSIFTITLTCFITGHGSRWQLKLSEFQNKDYVSTFVPWKLHNLNWKFDLKHVQQLLTRELFLHGEGDGTTSAVANHQWGLADFELWIMKKILLCKGTGNTPVDWQLHKHYHSLPLVKICQWPNTFLLFRAQTWGENSSFRDCDRSVKVTNVQLDRVERDSTMTPPTNEPCKTGLVYVAF